MAKKGKKYQAAHKLVENRNYTLDEAVGLLKKTSVTKFDSSCEAHFNLGVIYKEKGLIKEAIEEFQKTLKVKPDHENARMMLESLSQ